MLDFSFGDDPTPPVGEPVVDQDRLNKLIGVLSKKVPGGEHEYLLALTFDDMSNLLDFLQENALDSEKDIIRIMKRLETKIALIEKR